jgi:phosphatidate phosphatase LPIN
LKSSPFHVRFGKFKLFKPGKKIVHIKINGEDTGLMMRLGAEGEAYFIEQVSDLADSDSEADGGSMYAQSERGSV